jgi:hypothetical protein
MRGRRDFVGLSRDGSWLAFGPGFGNSQTDVDYIVLARPTTSILP